MNLKKPKIKWIDYGVACRIDDTIYINKELKKRKQLCRKIIEHEKDHTSGLSGHDIRIDLFNKHLNGNRAEYYSFIMTTPSSWVEFLPFGFYEGRFAFNPFMAAFWLFTIILLWGLFR